MSAEHGELMRVLCALAVTRGKRKSANKKRMDAHFLIVQYCTLFNIRFRQCVVCIILFLFYRSFAESGMI